MSSRTEQHELKMSPLIEPPVLWFVPRKPVLILSRMNEGSIVLPVLVVKRSHGSPPVLVWRVERSSDQRKISSGKSSVSGGGGGKGGGFYLLLYWSTPVRCSSGDKSWGSAHDSWSLRADFPPKDQLHPYVRTEFVWIFVREILMFPFHGSVVGFTHANLMNRTAR